VFGGSFIPDRAGEQRQGHKGGFLHRGAGSGPPVVSLAAFTRAGVRDRIRPGKFFLRRAGAVARGRRNPLGAAVGVSQCVGPWCLWDAFCISLFPLSHVCRSCVRSPGAGSPRGAGGAPGGRRGWLTRGGNAPRISAFGGRGVGKISLLFLVCFFFK